MTNQATGGGEVCKGEPVKIQQCRMNQCGENFIFKLTNLK
jgi:hypothetical protein